MTVAPDTLNGVTRPHMRQRAQALRAGAQPKGGKPTFYSLHVPPHLAEVVPTGMQFLCELTEEGILFRALAVEYEPTALPTWCSES